MRLKLLSHMKSGYENEITSSFTMVNGSYLCPDSATAHLHRTRLNMKQRSWSTNLSCFSDVFTYWNLFKLKNSPSLGQNPIPHYSMLLAKAAITKVLLLTPSEHVFGRAHPLPANNNYILLVKVMKQKDVRQKSGCIVRMIMHNSSWNTW